MGGDAGRFKSCRMHQMWGGGSSFCRRGADLGLDGRSRAHHTHHNGGSVHSAPPGQPFISRPLAPGLLPPFAPPANLPPGHRHFQPPSAAPQTARHLSSRITAAPRCRCPAEPLGLWPPGGGGERATSGGWSRAPPSTAWGVHLGRSRHRAESLGLFRCFPRRNFGGCPSDHNSNKHGGWGGDLSLHFGPCGGDNPLPLATRPFPISAAMMGGDGTIGSIL